MHICFAYIACWGVCLVRYHLQYVYYRDIQLDIDYHVSSAAFPSYFFALYQWMEYKRLLLPYWYLSVLKNSKTVCVLLNLLVIISTVFNHNLFYHVSIFDILPDTVTPATVCQLYFCMFINNNYNNCLMWWWWRMIWLFTKTTIYNWERWCVKWVRRLKVPAKANQPNGTWWRLIPRHCVET